MSIVPRPLRSKALPSLLAYFVCAATMPGMAAAQGRGGRGRGGGFGPPIQGGRTRVVVLGSGNPAANPDRFGPAVVVLVDSTPYLFDIGVGVVRRWAAALSGGIAPLAPSSLRHAFVTHLHSDHTLGYADLIFTSWTLDSAAPPLEVFGPPGLKTMTDHLIAAWAEDVSVRTGPGGEKEGEAPPVVRVHEIDGGVAYRDSLVTVTAFEVPHGSWKHAFGYRIETPDRVIVLSGDTGPSDAVIEQCRKCDLLLHEGGFIADDGASDYFRRFHTTVEELARIARAAEPGLLVLYHQRVDSPGTERARELLRSLYPGPFVVARDLDVFR